MTNKILQTSADVIVANANTYETKTVSISTPKIVTGNSTYTGITTGVEYENLKVNLDNMGEESIPNPSLFKRAHDYYAATDRLTVTLNISKLDTLNGVTDAFSRVVSYNRVFQESQVTNDSYKTFAVTKDVIDTGYLSEVYANSLSKPFTDTSLTTDIRSVEYGKNVFENITLTEEVLKLDYVKLEDDTVATQDVLTRTVDFNRDFSDFVDATDDFYGSANIDDDQIANVGKTLVDWLASSEVRVIDLSIVKSDVATSTDQKESEVTKVSVDTFSSSEQLVYSVDKATQDTTTTSDLQTYETGKALQDTGTTSEVKDFAVGKTLADTFGYAEEVSYSGVKYLNTGYTVQDVTTTAWSAYRSFDDLVASSTQISFSASTELLTSTSNTDTLANETTKVSEDSFITSDELSRTVDYNRDFADYIDATDDFYGAANIDDDQIANVGKSSIDWVNTGEQTAYDVSKVLADSYTAPDVLYSATYKVTSDTTGNVDVAFYSADKVLNTGYITQETVAVEAAKTTADTTTTTDLFARQVDFNRDVVDSSSASETVYLNTGKPIVDSTTTSDTTTLVADFNRSPTDIANSSETLSFGVSKSIVDILGLSEIPVFENSKILSDSFTKQDEIRNAPNKGVVDYTISTDYVTFYLFTNRYFDEIATTNDSGVINNQSYFAGSYVEPGYAGTNTYFS